MFSAEATAAREALQAGQTITAGQLVTAEELARAGLRAAPTDFGLYSVLAIALAEQGALDEAQTAADEAVAYNEGSGWPHLARARVFMLRARHDSYHRDDLLASAFIEFDQAVEIAPEEPIVWRLLAQACRDADKPQAAIQAAQQALAIAPDDSQTACLLADLLVHGNRVSEAEAVLAALPASSAGDPNVQCSRGRVLLHSQRIDEAADALQQAVDQGCAGATRLLLEARKGRHAIYQPWLRWQLWLWRHAPSPRWRRRCVQGLIAGLALWYWLTLNWESVVMPLTTPEAGLALTNAFLIGPWALLVVMGGLALLSSAVTLASDLAIDPPTRRAVAVRAGMLAIPVLLFAAFLALTNIVPKPGDPFWSGYEWIGGALAFLWGACLLGGFCIGVESYRSVVPPERRWLVLSAAVFPLVWLPLIVWSDGLRDRGPVVAAIALSTGATTAMAASRGRHRGAWTTAALVSLGLSLAALPCLLTTAVTLANGLAFVSLTLALLAIAYSIGDVMRAMVSAGNLQQLQLQRRRELEARAGG